MFFSHRFFPLHGRRNRMDNNNNHRPDSSRIWYKNKNIYRIYPTGSEWDYIHGVKNKIKEGEGGGGGGYRDGMEFIGGGIGNKEGEKEGILFDPTKSIITVTKLIQFIGFGYKPVFHLFGGRGEEEGEGSMMEKILKHGREKEYDAIKLIRKIILEQRRHYLSLDDLLFEDENLLVHYNDSKRVCDFVEIEDPDPNPEQDQDPPPFKLFGSPDAEILSEGKDGEEEFFKLPGIIEIKCPYGRNSGAFDLSNDSRKGKGKEAHEKRDEYKHFMRYLLQICFYLTLNPSVKTGYLCYYYHDPVNSLEGLSIYTITQEILKDVMEEMIDHFKEEKKKKEEEEEEEDEEEEEKTLDSILLVYFKEFCKLETINQAKTWSSISFGWRKKIRKFQKWLRIYLIHSFFKGTLKRQWRVLKVEDTMEKEFCDVDLSFLQRMEQKPLELHSLLLHEHKIENS